MAYRSYTLHAAAGATGDGTAMSLGAHRSGSIHYLDVGTPSAVLTFQGSADGTNWSPVSLLNAGGAYVATLAAPGIVHLPPHFALPFVRATMVWTSGAISVVGSSRP